MKQNTHLICPLSLIPDKKDTLVSSLNQVSVCPSCGGQFIIANVGTIEVKVCESCRIVLPSKTEVE